MSPLIHHVEKQDDGVPLVRILRDRMHISRTLLAKLKRMERGIELNGVRVYTNAIVRQGDRVEVRLAVEASEDILPQPLSFDILYEDDHLLIVNKAAGMIVHPTHGHYTGTLANGVVHYWQEQGKSYRFRPIHRLDQDTSGVLAIAKSAYVHQHVSEQMKRGKVDKTYIAFVHGFPSPSAGTVSAPIDRSDHNPHIRTVRADGYASITHYDTQAVYPAAGVSLLGIRLETGRTHQIRVHMKHIGHPLLGDPIYGPDNQDVFDETVLRRHQLISRHALHANSLTFIHPMSGQTMKFQAPLSADLALLRNHLDQVNVERMSKR